MDLQRMLLAFEPYAIVTVVLLDGCKTMIIYSGGSMDFRRRSKSYEVVHFHREKDGSYTILVKEMESILE